MLLSCPKLTISQQKSSCEIKLLYIPNINLGYLHWPLLQREPNISHSSSLSFSAITVKSCSFIHLQTLFFSGLAIEHHQPKLLINNGRISPTSGNIVFLMILHPFEFIHNKYGLFPFKERSSLVLM